MANPKTANRHHVPGLGVELSPAIRNKIEATIENLILLLDQFDGDENLEECAGDMPELDIAELGIADSDALDDPEITLSGLFFDFDGSGKRAAQKLLKIANANFPRCDGS